MKLWEKKTVPEPSVIEFTSGNDRFTDLVLADWDIIGSMAHARMLNEAGLISYNESKELIKALHTLFMKAADGSLRIGEGVEDIHSQIEMELTSMLGETGKKIHTGRSRNDQVLVDIRLYTRKVIDDTAKHVDRLFYQLLSLSEQYKSILIPGYTHMQPAMVSSFGLWFGSYAESLADDILLLSAARSLNNRNPLGTGAGYGSALPLKRRITKELWVMTCFIIPHTELNRARQSLQHLPLPSARTLSRLLWILPFMTAEFRFIDFPDEYNGFERIPKRNPDVFEIIRGKANLIQMLPAQVASVVSGLPSGYNREFQLLKDLLFRAFNETRELLAVMSLMLNRIIVTEGITGKPLYNSIFSTEEVNRLVVKGVPFRDAYREVAGMIGTTPFKPSSPGDYSHEGSIGNLCNKEIEKIFSGRMKAFIRSTYELAEKIMK